MIRAALLALQLAGSAAAQVPEPESYRGEPYRAPVPATLHGAVVIDAAQAIRLHEDGVPFLDVLPRKTRPEGLPDGTIWREPPHETIPGAVWLWNTGYENLSPAEQARLERGLEQASNGNPAAPLVMFCRSECWMSWNAARRAVSLGYTAVHWYPGGIEAWQQAGGAPLVRATPAAP